MNSPFSVHQKYENLSILYSEIESVLPWKPSSCPAPNVKQGWKGGWQLLWSTWRCSCFAKPNLQLQAAYTEGPTVFPNQTQRCQPRSYHPAERFSHCWDQLFGQAKTSAGVSSVLPLSCLYFLSTVVPNQTHSWLDHCLPAGTPRAGSRGTGEIPAELGTTTRESPLVVVE